ncbi:MAG: fimbrillin family protein [Phocaeicola sp.]
MNKKIFLLVIALVLAASGCTKHDVLGHSHVEVADPIYVNFDPRLDSQKSVTTTANNFSEFCVYGYQGINASDEPLNWDTSSPLLLMDSETVIKDNGGVWKTESFVLWPDKNTHVQFFAFSPVGSATYIKNSESGNKPALSFTANTDVTEQFDLLCAESEEIKTAVSGSHKMVPLAFTHALTKVRFSARVQQNQKLFISELSLHNLGSEGRFAYTTKSKQKGSWSGSPTKNKAYGVLLSENTQIGITNTDSVSVTATDGATLVIPQTRRAVDASFPKAELFTGNKTNSYIKVVYSLQNIANEIWLVGKSSEKSDQITAYIPVDVYFAMNNAINFIIDFGTGNGGYHDDGTDIIPDQNMIKVETEFVDWNDEVSVDVVPPPLFKDAVMKLTVYPNNYDGMTYRLPFVFTGETGDYTLTVDWGDGSAVDVFGPGTSLADGLKHTYSKTGNYSIAIMSSERNIEKAQVPGFKSDKSYAKLLRSIDSPLLHSASTDFNGAFAGPSSLKTVSADLFKYNKKATDFRGLFVDCKLLSAIPADLFKYNLEANNVDSVFKYCSSLEAIPEDLFKYNVGIKKFIDVFAGCLNIAEIPVDLFKHNIGATDFSGVFRGCDKLKTIPTDLFKNNLAATNFSKAFSGCETLDDVPSGLFKHNGIARNFSELFANCHQLKTVPADLFSCNRLATNFSGLFLSCTMLTDIPVGLFEHNVDAVNFSTTFKYCKALKEIPADLFKHNIKATDFSELFFSCENLKIVPAGLFRYNKAAYNFRSVFHDCTRAKAQSNIFCDEATEGSTRFDSLMETANFGAAFARFGAYLGEADENASILPALWGYTYKSTPFHTRCFEATKASNAAEARECWK